MFMVYSLMFLSGSIATVTIILIYKKIKQYYKEIRYRRRLIMEAEEDGWIKLGKEFPDWGSSNEMDNWVQKTKLAMEVAEWLDENTNGKFHCRYATDQNRYIKFDQPEDAMAFKLRWI